MSRVTTNASIDREWWKEAVVYQIYPRSFNDTTGNGIGDLPGILEKVEYLDSLGVDVIWLCPVYDSPNKDNGYDIREYRSILDAFGDLDDWESLLGALHDRDMRLIMDLVVNHTSSEHEWFQRSRRCEGKYEEYYHWRDGTPEEPPNNWTSIFGGPAWSYEPEREQWYLHLFDEHQPDLNWRNPAVRADIKSMITWWLEKGIDGFRLDAIDFLSKADGLPDGDPEQSPVGLEHFVQGPQLREYLQELSDEVFSNYDIMTVGEMGQTTIEQTATHLGEDGDGLDMIFQFDHMGVDESPNGQWDIENWGSWDLPEFKEIMTYRQEQLSNDGWNALFLGNHDLPRIVSRFGDEGEYREASAKLLATFLLTMRGTPYIYQGEEIGMTNTDFQSLEAIDDIMTIGMVEDLRAEGRIDSYEEVRDLVNYRSRDHARTPMQWSDSAHAGFTDSDPWLKTHPNYTDVNVEAAIADPESVWQHYQSLIALRDASDILVYGEYDLLLPEDEQLYVYTRTLGERQVLVVLNWSGRPTQLGQLPLTTIRATVLHSNYESSPTEPAHCDLRPYEAVVYEL